MRGRATRVLCTDNPWLGTPKQYAGRLVARAFIQPAFDLAFLPGERQMVFARMLGFGDDELLWGLYAGDQPRFAGAAAGRASLDRSFLFVGRLAPEKGVDVLATAYADYRSRASDPWPLLVVGTGPLAPELEGAPGVSMLGFLQPEELPAQMAASGCLVLPSRFEPWGVVVHEAASAGLAIICTDPCGATTRLVLDGYNGRVIAADDASALSDALSWIADRAPEELETLGRRSSALSEQLSPRRWASYLLDRLESVNTRVT
ncbi:MAG: glycosyltransferase family 4 protein [Acidimicrobiales bacterium]